MFFLLLAVALLAHGTNASYVCGTQYQNLYAIFHALDGAHWTTNNWFSSTDVCTWTGITCNKDGLIVGIDLSDMQLKGQIPDAVGCFPFLQSLYLNDNKLTGTIPTALCNDIQLQYLQLDNATLHGHIPTCICNITTLHYFYLDNNDLDGTIPTCLGSMTSLSDFHAQCNDLTGSLPGLWSTDAWLRELHLYCNPHLTCPVSSPNPNLLEYQCNTAPVGCDGLCYDDQDDCPEKVYIPLCGWYYQEDGYMGSGSLFCPPLWCKKQITVDDCGKYHHECHWP